jgi:hypothetical protein
MNGRSGLLCAFPDAYTGIPLVRFRPTVLRYPIQRHRRPNGRARFAESLAGPALVPLHFREALFPRGKVRERPETGYVARPSMQEQETGLFRFSPRIVTHCSIPPIETKLASSIPFAELM